MSVREANEVQKAGVAAAPKEDEIIHVRFREAVIFNRLTETHLDTRKHKNLLITWHPKGILLESDGVPKVVVPASNLVSVEVK